MSTLSKEKTLGRISPDQFARTLSLMDGMETWADVFKLLKQKPRFRRLTEDRRVGFSWAAAYELDYQHMLAALLLLIAEPEDLRELDQADDKTEYVLRQAEDDEFAVPTVRVKARKALLALGLLMALTKSAESLSLYSVSMNELVRRARHGDREAVVRAVRIDPSVLAAPSVSHQLSLAVMRKEKKFLRRIQKAFDGPHKGLYPYKKLRYSALILQESGALTPKNREHVFEVVANQLKLYEQSRGDPFKGLFTQFERWNRFSAT
jgi:hypothetical protein